MAIGCFIPDLNWNDLTKLDELRVSAVDFTLGSHSGKLIDESDLRRVVDYLELEITRQDPTEIEGIVKISYRRKSGRRENDMVFQDSIFTNAVPTMPRVVVQENNSGKVLEGLTNITSDILLPAIQKEIVIHDVFNQRKDPVSDGRFHIFIGSGVRPKGDGIPTPEYIWNTFVQNEVWDERRYCSITTSYSPSGNGVEIRDGTYAVAEILGDNLFIFHCLSGVPQGYTPYRDELYRKILEKTVESFNLSPEEKERIEQLRLSEIETRKRAQRERYIKICTNRKGDRVNQLNRTIESSRRQTISLEEQLGREYRNIETSLTELHNIENNQKAEDERFGLEFDQLAAQEKITDIEIDQSYIHIYTDMLYCTDPRTNRVHQIGKFKISMSLQGERIVWKNQSYQITGFDGDKMQAPHIFADGHACLGDAAYLPKLLGSYHYAMAAQVAIQFVESVNVHDAAGKCIDHWPLAPDDKQGGGNR